MSIPHALHYRKNIIEPSTKLSEQRLEQETKEPAAATLSHLHNSPGPRVHLTECFPLVIHFPRLEASSNKLDGPLTISGTGCSGERIQPRQRSGRVGVDRPLPSKIRIPSRPSQHLHLFFKIAGQCHILGAFMLYLEFFLRSKRSRNMSYKSMNLLKTVN